MSVAQVRLSRLLDKHSAQEAELQGAESAPKKARTPAKKATAKQPAKKAAPKRKK
jgi:hypothetical protein